MPSRHAFSLAVVACVAASAAATPAFAQQPYYPAQPSQPPPPQIYARVVSKTPVFRQVRIEVPRQECRDVQVQQTDPNANTKTAAGVLLGGVIGGVLGHQVGGGRGKDVATAVGAVAGAATGAGIANNNQAPTQTQTVKQCQQVMDYRTEQQPDGYDVAYQYGDVVYHTHSAYDPGNSIAIRVSVTPLQ